MVTESALDFLAELCCLLKEVTAMSHNNQEGFDKGMALAFLVLLLFFAQQYWKPDFYWNSSKIKFLRSIIGDLGVDITVYTVVGGNFLGMLMHCINKQRN